MPPSQPVHEGIFGKYLTHPVRTQSTNKTLPAIHKPTSISSYDVIRRLQPLFKSSTLFTGLQARDRQRNLDEPRTKSRFKRDKKELPIKLGHGGTLDPMATGVLIIGVGNGTKSLSKFLECTKSYECTVLFGCATDSYDAKGKVMAQADFEHVTKEGVEAALEGFKGKIMQKPPIFSALKVNGKKMYEYAREGGEIPEVKERPVTVEKLELVEWLPGGSHPFEFPGEEVEKEMKEFAARILKVKGLAPKGRGVKRKLEDDEQVEPPAKISRTSPSPEPEAFSKEGDEEQSPPPHPDDPKMSGALQPVNKLPPAARLSMTVTSGFYVRSLCHDLGEAVGSLGIMSSLVRSRQGDFVLGENVLEWEDLEKGEDVWGPQIESMLDKWRENEENGKDRSEGEDGEKEGAGKKKKVHPRRERRNSSSVEP
jgi:tRNA pseudouridine55 synthase